MSTKFQEGLLKYSNKNGIDASIPYPKPQKTFQLIKAKRTQERDPMQNPPYIRKDLRETVANGEYSREETPLGLCYIQVNRQELYDDWEIQPFNSENQILPDLLRYGVSNADVEQARILDFKDPMELLEVYTISNYNGHDERNVDIFKILPNGERVHICGRKR